MNKALRWRIMTLQVVLVLALGFTAGFLYWGSNFATSYVHDQLVAQQIYFPASSQIKAGGALDPAEFPASIRQYAGQQVDTGDKAKEYANNFIGKHLDKVAGGKTYSQVSALAAASPTDTKLAAQKTTLFQGETLRGLLLSAWGWSQVGLYAGYAAAAMTLATIAVFLALVYETILAIASSRRKETQTLIVASTHPATA